MGPDSTKHAAASKKPVAMHPVKVRRENLTLEQPVEPWSDSQRVVEATAPNWGWSSPGARLILDVKETLPMQLTGYSLGVKWDK